MIIVANLDLIVITTCCVIGQCFSTCPESCTSCTNNKCYSCKDGYFLYNGECPQCPLTCRLCESQDFCYDCLPNYWNLTAMCSMQCPFNCLYSCEVINGFCYSCKPNFYGNDCSQDCALCRYGHCTRQGCASGCYDGYFPDNDQGYTLCRQCSSNCSKCGSLYNCTECQPYFYLDEYLKTVGRVSDCKPCSPGCASCIDEDRCLSCQGINNCKECKFNGTAFTCSVCDNGWYVQNGQCSASRQCPAGCLNGCDISGACYQCRDGFSGHFCNNSCSELCLGCSNESPYWCEQCKDADLLTPMCKDTCSENCLKINGKSTCQLENGNCLNGCMAGRWGTTCENNCSINCQKNANSQPDCNVLTGSCTYGCMTGFTDQACGSEMTTANETLKTTYTSNVGQPTVAEVKTFPLTTVVGALAGGIVVGAVSVIVVFILWKRLRKKPQFRSHVYANAEIDMSKHDDIPGSSIEMNVPSSETLMYEHLLGRIIENNYSDAYSDFNP